MKNIKLAVKCFKNKEKAIEEDKIWQGIQVINNCPGILPYYGMQELQIE